MSGADYFYANKASRNAAFSYPNFGNLDAEVDGDQSARLCPTPARLDNSQKVGNPLLEPAPDDTKLRSPSVGRLRGLSDASGQANG